MRSQKICQTLFITGAILACLGIFLFVYQGKSSLFGIMNATELIAQNTNTYLGPKKSTPGNPHLVRVQVLVYDSALQGGVQIQEVHLNGKNIPLKPRDIHGFRGQASFQMVPGRYSLIWTMHRDRFIWPRTITHEEIVNINPRDYWIQIAIEGEEASIR